MSSSTSTPVRPVRRIPAITPHPDVRPVREAASGMSPSPSPNAAVTFDPALFDARETERAIESRRNVSGE